MTHPCSAEMALRFDEALSDILHRLADGSTLANACAAHNLTRQSFRDYITARPDAGLAYDRAREAQTEALMDELIEVMNSTTIDPRLQANKIKALQWLVEKRDPAKYGQKASIEHNIKGGLDLGRALGEADKREQALLARRAAAQLLQAVITSPIPVGSDAEWAQLVGPAE